MTGGAIHSAALNAAFLAAEAGSPVTMKVLLCAVRGEFLKLERPINETDFRWLEPAVSSEDQTTTFVPSAFKGHVNAHGHLIMKRTTS